MKFFMWPAGQRESSFEDGRCKVPSVGAVKSAECGMMPVGSGMVPLADPEVRFGSGYKFCPIVLNLPLFLLSPRI